MEVVGEHHDLCACRGHLRNIHMGCLLEWIRRLAAAQEVRWLVPAHYEAPLGCSPELLKALADGLEQRPWAPNEGSWAYLASIDERLVRLKLVPGGSVGTDGSGNP